MRQQALLVMTLSLLFGRYSAVLLYSEGEAWHVIGCVTPAQQQTLDLVMLDGPLTSSIIAERLSIHIAAASNRLRDLATLGLVKRVARPRRDGPGREFVYTALIRAMQGYE